MSLTTPRPGLRVRNRSNSPQRVELIVAAGDTLEVSEDLAAQLAAASGAFKAEPVPVEAPSEPAGRSSRPRKATPKERTA